MPEQSDQATVVALAETLRALAHPVRIRALGHAQEGVELSATTLHRAMPDVSLAAIAYHVRQLAGAGLLRQIRQVPRRGAVEHLYLLTPKGVAIATVLAEVRRQL